MDLIYDLFDSIFHADTYPVEYNINDYEYDEDKENIFNNNKGNDNVSNNNNNSKNNDNNTSKVTNDKNNNNNNSNNNNNYNKDNDKNESTINTNRNKNDKTVNKNDNKNENKDENRNENVNISSNKYNNSTKTNNEENDEIIGLNEIPYTKTTTININLATPTLYNNNNNNNNITTLISNTNNVPITDNNNNNNSLEDNNGKINIYIATFSVVLSILAIAVGVVLFIVHKRDSFKKEEKNNRKMKKYDYENVNPRPKSHFSTLKRKEIAIGVHNIYKDIVIPPRNENYDNSIDINYKKVEIEPYIDPNYIK
ncbi:hypothetical protein BCR32DRAFT_291719 [Anaeromyces robustus]|uniref:Uncharacterized protein n=1 Tax=Anaeromyces robustus TaxID=1754192 RepID=A0A1Y1XDL9_9FUNG|nr:hypothetical protein BCR32DRAFT_291719 [Anaeromyces robustus]|eukprot:ORX83823.1 hypothetical protein BCR32DRAFT_291719 [Anaeromyces robustus]